MVLFVIYPLKTYLDLCLSVYLPVRIYLTPQFLTVVFPITGIMHRR